MRIIDNLNEYLGDNLKASIKPGSKLRIAASTFSIFAFEALKEELQSIDELEFIFTAPSFTTTKATDKPAPEKRQFFIPNDKNRDAALYGTEFEIRLRNKLTQRAIARECAEWVRQKVTFRSNHTGAPMQALAAVDEDAAYFPIQGFTTADLGYERGPAVSNVVTKFEGASETRQFVQLFDQIWHNPDQLDDVTETVRDHIASVYAENSPQRVYYLILYNLFSEFLEDVSEDGCDYDLPRMDRRLPVRKCIRKTRLTSSIASLLSPRASAGRTTRRTDDSRRATGRSTPQRVRGRGDAPDRPPRRHCADRRSRGLPLGHRMGDPTEGPAGHQRQPDPVAFADTHRRRLDRRAGSRL
ncbi:hypothetical protein [Tessaracoccus oleiagri]|uniref:hypothetical protein n=1 Tax=Tessaracoccus oleiagri TaxID=686624 RepID=UPI000A70A530|nr:hypothetical protein [Tessaracoccus oleiagri]